MVGQGAILDFHNFQHLFVFDPQTLEITPVCDQNFDGIKQHFWTI